MAAGKSFNPGVVVVAAGRGERAGVPEEGPKQYRPIGGMPVISHTLSGFVEWAGASAGIVVVIHPDDEALFRDALSHVRQADGIQFVYGGDTRQQSVLNGLEALERANPSHVLIHDAVRPFFDAPLIERICAALKAGDNAVLPAIAVADTLKQADAHHMVAGTVPRAGLFAAQTPQAFDFAVIFDAHRRAAAEQRFDFTDDAGIAEWAGLGVRLVDGLADNVKLTFRRDLAMADEKLSQNLIADIRTGNGYDVHKLVPGDGVTLCGVRIPHDMTLSGHSDADVAFHALTDALLATCGEGDIGDHFPPSDPQWKGAASNIFLAHAAKIVRDKGGVILNADVSLIAEAPKVGPHRNEMRQKIADCLGIDLARCSVKATTNETIGFVGRGEGIAAIATASVSYGNMR
ncbi:bifunctional 2-C-methyl-D-erythritol 4-phosphate cytidylyltransferase/2-C-methyl-D-erythritol 2,4-cyclodiphosphate synthase [Martelella mangrovi]|uniref:Bifunctional enzyme IspD/IspF n=1 Tax=Martelella mangrovi TaxID=1397477 RepID=A0ABV2IAT1_9HYPH